MSHSNPNDKGAHKVIMSALIADAVVSSAKLIVAFFSGSAAMLAEGLHSLADTSNQILLLIGRKLGRRPADESHPFGYGKERFFWPFLVSIVSFSVGGVFAIMNGVRQIVHPHELEHIAVSYWILLLAFIMDGFALYVAWSELRRVGVSKHGKRTIGELLKESKSPAVVAAFLLDIGATIGVVIAALGLWFSSRMQMWQIDGITSIFIGALLFVISWAIAVEAKSLLIGESASPEHVKKIRETITAKEEVVRVTDLLTMHLSPDEILVNIDVEFKDGLTTEQIEAVIDEIESEIREVIPEASKIFVEAETIAKVIRKRRPKK